MERRHLLNVSAAAALGALAACATAQSHDHHHHHGGGGRYQAVADAAAACVSKGESCIAHCLVLMAGGDTSVARCAQSVNQLLATCTALQKLALQDSAYVPRFARVAMDLCEECEKECRKHADKHKECKECAESCAECHKACKAIAA